MAIIIDLIISQKIDQLLSINLNIQSFAVFLPFNLNGVHEQELIINWTFLFWQRIFEKIARNFSIVKAELKFIII